MCDEVCLYLLVCVVWLVLQVGEIMLCRCIGMFDLQCVLWFLVDDVELVFVVIEGQQCWLCVFVGVDVDVIMYWLVVVVDIDIGFRCELLLCFVVMQQVQFVWFNCQVDFVGCVVVDEV